MRIQIVDLIEDFILGMNFTQAVLSFSTGGGNTTIVLTNTWHAKVGLTIIIDTVPFVIISANSATGEVVVPGILGAAVLATISTPFYKHGTPIATNNEITPKDENQKFPLIYLVEIIEENINNSTDSRTKNNAILRFHFIDRRLSEWDTDENYSNVVNGLRNLGEKFIADLQGQPLVNRKELLTYQFKNLPKFGVESTNKGVTNSLFNERAAAVQLTVTVPFLNLDPCVDITPFQCPSLCTLIDSAPSQDTVDCIDAAGKTAEVQALICPSPQVGTQFDHPLYPGLTIKYADNDDKDKFDNGVYNYIDPINPLICQKIDFDAAFPLDTLKFDNENGNKVLWANKAGDYYTPGTTSLTYDNSTFRLFDINDVPYNIATFNLSQVTFGNHLKNHLTDFEFDRSETIFADNWDDLHNVRLDAYNATSPFGENDWEILDISILDDMQNKGTKFWFNSRSVFRVGTSGIPQKIVTSTTDPSNSATYYSIAMNNNNYSAESKSNLIGPTRSNTVILYRKS